MGYNILVINWQDIRNPLGGGAEVHLHEIFKRIVEMGHQVTLLCCKHKDLPGEEIVDGIRVIRRSNRNFFNFSVPFYYRELKKQNNFDIVIDDINKIPFYTPHFVKEPIIGIIHHLFGSSIFIEAALPVALYVKYAEKLIPRVYQNIPMAVVSNSTKEELVSKGFREENISLVYNAVDASAYQYEPEKKSSKPVIGYLGRIKKYKSVNHLILAFDDVIKTIPEAELILVGDGDYLPEVKRLTAKLNLQNKVTFTGATHFQSKIDCLNNMWFMVNPSPKEGWGLTVIEANSCGLPVIAANSPGLRDSVVDGKTGLLYPYGDTKKLAQLMINLIQNNKLRNSFTKPCINWASQFNWNKSANDMIKLITDVLTRRETDAK
ncbi:glycosyltransferase family 4 protein [candidate division KSB1 bacterium]|nr:glycosyltransferase family 4 protein [candidate division KSB1 bacterium]